MPYPVLTAFDTPNGDASCVRRPRSNTPLQALATLNETLFLESARALARTVLTDGEFFLHPILPNIFCEDDNLFERIVSQHALDLIPKIRAAAQTSAINPYAIARHRQL